VSRIDKMTGLFCKRDLSKRLYSAKKTYIYLSDDKSAYEEDSARYGVASVSRMD